MHTRSLVHAVRLALPLCFVALTVSGCNDHAASGAGNAPPAAAVALVQNGSIAHTLSLAGQFEPFQMVEVHAKVSGYIRKIYVDIGDRVHAGQTLAVLDVPELNAQYRASASEALRSRDQIEAAQHDVAHARSLHAALQAAYQRLQKASAQQPGLIAAQELDDARSQAEASQAQIDAAQSELSGAKQGADTTTADEQRMAAMQSYTKVTAPLSGVITWRYADTGALIQAGTNSDTQSLPIVKLSQSDVLRLRVPVPEDAVRYVHIGEPMQIRVDALGSSFSGKVVRFTRNLDPATRTMETEVDVPNPDLTITPGMYANTFLQLAQVQNVPTVPLTAVQGTGHTGTVLVLNAQNQVEQRQVQLGLRGSVLVQVTGGLTPGDRVILGDPSRYPVGERVTPRVQQEPVNDAMQEEGGVTDPNAPSGGASSGAGGN
jgi:RND family efflux transporter MFP subunit